MTPFVDAHTHSRARSGVVFLLNSHFTLPAPEEKTPGALLSLGIHPRETLRFQFHEMEKLFSDGKFDAVGECGLDRSIDIPFDAQKDVFIKQADLAGSLGLPLVIHCVKAYYDIAAIKKILKPSVPWLIHGFRGGVETADALLRHGLVLSLSANAVLFDNTFPSVFASRPFLLESDETGVPIEDIYQKFADGSGLEPDLVKERTYKLFRGVFNYES